jgi:hypothetical protein
MITLESAKVTTGYVLGTLAFAGCLYFAWIGPNPILQVLLCLFGGTLGWIVGIAITPLDGGEKKQFSDYAKAVSAVISGFAIAKADSLLAPLSRRAADNLELLLTRSLLVSVCFFVALLFTFIGRRYVHSSENERRERRQTHLEEVQEALNKLAQVQ